MHSERHRLIYLHPPKTGGNSIQSVLLPFSDDRKVLVGHQDGRDRFEVRGPATASKHATLADYASSLDIAAYRVAISVRHPFDRAVSFFFSPHRWMRQTEDGWSLATPVWDRVSFLAFLDGVPSLTSFLTVNGALRRPDFVIRYESIESDVRHLAGVLGVPLASLPHVNRSAASDDVLHAVRSDRDLRSVVCARYAEDMALFGYTD